MKRILPISIFLAGCVVSISQPRGRAHLAAMHDASRHFHHGRFEEAEASFAEAARTAERRVDRDEAMYADARTLRRLHRDRDALPLLDEIAARRPFSRRTVRALFDAALIRIELGEIERGRADLLTIVREHPDDGPASRALRLLLEARESEPVQPRLRFIEDLYAEVGSHDVGDDLLAAEARLRLEIEDRSGAARALERLVREHPYPYGQRWDDALLRLADLAEERGDHEGAIAYLEQLLSVHQPTPPPGSYTLPTQPGARLRIARIYRDGLHDPALAEAHFRGMYEQFPTSTLRDDALFELAQMWLDAGRIADACAMFARIVSEFEVGHARRLAAGRVEHECADGTRAPHAVDPGAAQ